jgi:hypothetical protein
MDDLKGCLMTSGPAVRQSVEEKSKSRAVRGPNSPKAHPLRELMCGTTKC